MAQVGSMVQTGNELIAQTEQLESGMQKGVKEPVTNIVKELTVLQKELDGLNTQLTNLKTTCESKVTELNTAIDDYNNKSCSSKECGQIQVQKRSVSQSRHWRHRRVKLPVMQKTAVTAVYRRTEKCKKLQLTV